MGKGNSNKAPMPPATGYHVIETITGKTLGLNIVGQFDDAMIYLLDDGRYGQIMNSFVGMMHPMKKPETEEKKESE